MSHLLPIRLLPQRVIGYLTKQAQVKDYATATPLTEAELSTNHHVIYLLFGSLECSIKGAHQQVIAAKTTKAAFPLRFDDQEVITKEPTRLLYFSRDLIQSAEKIAADGSLSGKPGPDAGQDPGIFTDLVEDAKTGNLELPSAPDLGVRIGRAIDNPDANSNEIARIIQMDPALTARLIQVANSPLYSGLGQITNCTTAVTRLGMATTRNLVISFLLKNLFRSQSKVLQKAMDDVWAQSIKVAAISSVLAKVTPRLEPGRALLAGLIYQIGAIAVINDAKRHAEISRDAEALQRAVKQIGPQVGAIILEQWNFGDDLVDVVLNSGNWMRDQGDEPSYTDLVMIARLHSQIGKPGMAHLPRLDLVPAFHKLMLGQLTPKMSIAILDQSAKDIQEVEALLS
jgi:HD-like signal output (HDOD) protein